MLLERKYLRLTVSTTNQRGVSAAGTNTSQRFVFSADILRVSLLCAVVRLVLISAAGMLAENRTFHNFLLEKITSDKKFQNLGLFQN